MCGFFFTLPASDTGGESGGNWWDAFDLSALGDLFGNLIDGIVNLGNIFKEGLISLGKFIADALTLLGKNILDGIKALFIPKEGELEQAIDNIKYAFNSKFGVGNFSVSDAIGAEKAMTNTTVSLDIGGIKFNAILVDWSFVDKALVMFRPYIRGFLAFMIIIYNINQFLYLIGQQGLAIGINKLLNSPSSSPQNNEKGE